MPDVTVKMSEYANKTTIN